MEEEGRPRRREQRGERVVVVSAAPVGKAIGPAAEVAAAGPMKESQGQGSPVSSRTRAPAGRHGGAGPGCHALVIRSLVRAVQPETYLWAGLLADG